MRSREVVTKDNYKQIVLKRMIIVCWILLAVCFVVKIFGGNFFNIICENKGFIKVCDYIENTFWYYVVTFITSYIGNYFLWLIMFDKEKFPKKQFWILNLIFIITFICQSILYHFGLSNFIFIISLIRYVIVPLCFKCSWKRVLVVNILDIVFQLITMITKSIAILQFDTNVIIALIFMIDYYIMLVLSYLYNNQLRIRR